MLKLKVLDIPEEGRELKATAAADSWYAAVVREAFQKDFSNHAAALDLFLLRTGANVTLTGSADIDLTPTCARCLEPFEYHFSVPFELFLSPAKGNENEEDLNTSFYQGNSFDLSELIREFLILSIPLRYLCKEDCKGIQ